ncbi:MAG TPA: hypothetical protein VFE17_13070 [Candidatus Baltobacteraceae bacterium]|jgi:hypothetical protein|nr:hypothetical protein [Candidatus Baltobacteraceae bacterium]
MQGRPRVRARLEELRFEIDELSKRIDEHLEDSSQYRSVRGFIDKNAAQEPSETRPPDENSGEAPQNGHQIPGD